MLHFDEALEGQGVRETPFSLEVDDDTVHGVLWEPLESTSVPLVLLAHGATQDKQTPLVRSVARSLAKDAGIAAASIDAPEHGSRVLDQERALEERASLLERMAAQPGAPRPAMPEGYRERHRELCERWSVEFSVTLDQLLATNRFDASRIGFWGLSMGTSVGVPLLARDERISCCVLGLNGIAPGVASTVADHASEVTAATLLVLQRDDPLVPFDAGLALFDAIAAKDRQLHAFPGGHLETPAHERRAYTRFFADRLAR